MKIFKHSILATAFIALSALSCDKAERPASMPEVTETVSYSISLDQQTRALGEGNSITHIWCGAYKEVNNNGLITYTLSSESLTPFTDGIAQCKVDMVRDQSYKVVFIGQHYNDQTPVYEIVKESARVNMPVIAVTNSDDYDIFTYVDPVVNFKPRAARNVTLSRCVAQINFLAKPADLAAALTAGKSPEKSTVTLTDVPEYIYLLDGTVSETSVNVEYSEQVLTSLPENTLASVFCLASDTSEDINASLYIYKGTEELKSYTSVSIPCKANYQTNVTVSYTFE